MHALIAVSFLGGVGAPGKGWLSAAGKRLSRPHTPMNDELPCSCWQCGGSGGREGEARGKSYSLPPGFREEYLAKFNPETTFSRPPELLSVTVQLRFGRGLNYSQLRFSYGVGSGLNYVQLLFSYGRGCFVTG